ncbi:MAG: cytochrome c biogenesis protein CcsA [Thermodesulfobacteriota bacterium]|nr:cytochrome c biogenesis protein CcsA [Thermodesulfobacteriota bacterium]MEE2975263.1 cytochrome c biogenesis protein CcsA [Thermodesulfobacteriota bacterium]
MLKILFKFSPTISLILISISLYMIFIYAPREIVMGDVQRIFYFHMAYVLVFTIAFIMNLFFSIKFLVDNKKINSVYAYVNGEIGVVFTLLTIISGMFWAKPIWGTWWTWDPQLTTTFILLLLYSSYLVFHKLSTSAGVPRYAAVFAIISFIDLPIVYISVRVMRGISPVVFGGEGGGISPEMMDTLLVTLAGFFFLYLSIFDLRLKLDK